MTLASFCRDRLSVPYANKWSKTKQKDAALRYTLLSLVSASRMVKSEETVNGC